MELRNCFLRPRVFRGVQGSRRFLIFWVRSLVAVHLHFSCGTKREDIDSTRAEELEKIGFTQVEVGLQSVRGRPPVDPSSFRREAIPDRSL